MAPQINSQGFTLVELLATIVIVSILSGVGIVTYREQTKKAYATELQTQLSAASRKLISTVRGFNETTEADCIASAELQNSNNFAYSCTKRDGEGNIYDIAAKPLRNIGVGGILSFGIGYDKICWDTSNASGSGPSAVLSKSHLGLSDNCSALTRNVRTYKCNCTRSYEQTGRKAIMNCSTWITCRRVGWRPVFGWVESCDTCTDITYTNENGVVVDVE